MDFLCGWLLKHPDVEVHLCMTKDVSDDRTKLRAKMVCDNGFCITRMVSNYEYGFMHVIFDEMYSKLIREGGSV